MSIFGGSDAQDNGNATDTVRAVDTALLHDAVLASVGRGWLLSFGASRDGFAVSLTVIVGKEKERAWCEDKASLEKALESVLSAATDQDVPKDAPPVIKGKKRPV